jgi:hypothetical protein
VTGARVTPPETDRRDLVFRPADPARAATLTARQVTAFNADGFVAPLPVFDAAEVARVRHYVDDLVAKVVTAPDRRNAYSVLNYQLVCRGIYDLIFTPRILDYVTDLLGESFVCWGTHLFYKRPRDPMEVPAHQDAVFWPLTPAGTVTVWLALDDVDAQNGAVRFVPGSHLGGPLPHVEAPLDGTRTLHRAAVEAAEAVEAAPDRPPHVNALRAGEASIHTDLLLHGSPLNPSGRRRAGLTFRYAAGDVRPLPGAEWYVRPTVHVRGTVPGHWPNRPRPTSEHPELMSRLWGGFDGNPGGAERPGQPWRM